MNVILIILSMASLCLTMCGSSTDGQPDSGGVERQLKDVHGIPLFVQLPRGDVHAMDVRTDATVGDLYQEMQILTRRSKGVLSIGAVELLDDFQALADAGVVAECALQYTPGPVEVNVDVRLEGSNSLTRRYIVAESDFADFGRNLRAQIQEDHREIPAQTLCIGYGPNMEDEAFIKWSRLTNPDQQIVQSFTEVKAFNEVNKHRLEPMDIPDGRSWWMYRPKTFLFKFTDEASASAVIDG